MSDMQNDRLYKCNVYNPYLDLSRGGSYTRLHITPGMDIVHRCNVPKILKKNPLERVFLRKLKNTFISVYYSYVRYGLRGAMQYCIIIIIVIIITIRQNRVLQCKRFHLLLHISP